MSLFSLYKMKFKYPKITLLVIFIALAYVLFKIPSISSWINNLEGLSYLGTFIGGMLYSFGFSAPFATGFFIALKPENILLAAILGGIGSLATDLIIFNFVKFSFKDEFNSLSKTKTLKSFNSFFDNHFSLKIKRGLLYFFAGILIASPLPDEAGVTILAGLTSIKQKTLAIISVILNTLGILIILL